LNNSARGNVRSLGAELPFVLGGGGGSGHHIAKLPTRRQPPEKSRFFFHYFQRLYTPTVLFLIYL
jgi:hypothetical protein